MQEYKSRSHTVWDCKYHIVWTTKYRYPVLKGDVGLRCRELLREIAMSKEMIIYAGDHGGIPRPNVKEAGKNIAPNGQTFIDKGRVRKPKPDEIPGGN